MRTKPKRIGQMVRLDPAIFQKLEMAAQTSGRSIPELIRACLAKDYHADPRAEGAGR